MDRRKFMVGAASVALASTVPLPAAPVRITGTITGRWTSSALYAHVQLSRIDMKRLLLARAYGGDARCLDIEPDRVKAINDMDWGSIERRVMANMADGRDPYFPEVLKCST